MADTVAETKKRQRLMDAHIRRNKARRAAGKPSAATPKEAVAGSRRTEAPTTTGNNAVSSGPSGRSFRTSTKRAPVKVSDARKAERRAGVGKQVAETSARAAAKFDARNKKPATSPGKKPAGKKPAPPKNKSKRNPNAEWARKEQASLVKSAGERAKQRASAATPKKAKGKKGVKSIIKNAIRSVKMTPSKGGVASYKSFMGDD